MRQLRPAIPRPEPDYRRPGRYADAKGIVKLNSATDSTSTTEAATPSAVKAAMDKANAAAPANHTHTQFLPQMGHLRFQME